MTRREHYYHSECGKKTAYTRHRITNGYHNGIEWYCRTCRVVVDKRTVEWDTRGLDVIPDLGGIESALRGES